MKFYLHAYIKSDIFEQSVPESKVDHKKMEASKRPAENGSNGDAENGAKKSKLDPDCGRLLFCGTTEWHNVRNIKHL